jgi:hypothetical protein
MGKLAEVKTKPTTLSVKDFINNIPNEQKRKDSLVLLDLMEKAVNEKPKIWGDSIIGFGYVRVKSPSGREVEWFKIGFSPRKTNISLYFSLDTQTRADALQKLGKHKAGVGCVYINKLEDVDRKVLEGMIKATVKQQ